MSFAEIMQAVTRCVLGEIQKGAGVIYRGKLIVKQQFGRFAQHVIHGFADHPGVGTRLLRQACGERFEDLPRVFKLPCGCGFARSFSEKESA